MLRTFGTKKKVFIIGIMITLTITLIIYLLKKALQKREEYLQILRDKELEGHGGAAIHDEQAEQKVKDVTHHHADIKPDLHHYEIYQEFLPSLLWAKTTLIPELFRIDQFKPVRLQKESKHQIEQGQDSSDSIDQSLPHIELTTFYQSFTKHFRVILHTLNNLTCFQTADSKLIQIKLMIIRNDKVLNDIETTRSYEIANTVLMDEKFTFFLLEKDFIDCTLYFTVWSIDVFYHETLLGAVSIDLRFYDYHTRKTIIEHVIPVKKDENIYGYLLVSLCHLPLVERLVCVVMSAKQLHDDIKSTSLLDNEINPYVKIALLNDGKLIKRNRTSVAMETSNPFFNEMIEFYIPEEQIKTVDILLIALHQDQNTSSRTIGKLLIGSHASGDTAFQHWNTALNEAETSIAMWHPLTR